MQKLYLNCFNKIQIIFILSYNWRQLHLENLIMRQSQYATISTVCYF